MNLRQDCLSVFSRATLSWFCLSTLIACSSYFIACYLFDAEFRAGPAVALASASFVSGLIFDYDSAQKSQQSATKPVPPVKK